MNKKKWMIVLWILIAALILDIGVVGAAVLKTVRKSEEETKKDEIEEELFLFQYPVSETVREEDFMDRIYYVMEARYPGEYSQHYRSFEEENQEEERDSSGFFCGIYERIKQWFSEKKIIDEENYDFEQRAVMSYEAYQAYCSQWGLEQKYTDSSKNYIVYSRVRSAFDVSAQLAAVEYMGNNVNLYIWDGSSRGAPIQKGYVIIVPTDSNVESIEIQQVYTENEYEELVENDGEEDMEVYKPIIYLYPQKEMKVFVNLGKPEAITCSYPSYPDKGWSVNAEPKGKLWDLETGRELYALYYESKTLNELKMEKEGFVVKKEDTARFLEEKLEILGLTPREAEEFIVFWLPKLEANTYNYIRFASKEEIDENMPLNINPAPDTVIRVWMTYKALAEPLEVKEQELGTPERTGFAVVEWGGIELME